MSHRVRVMLRHRVERGLEPTGVLLLELRGGTANALAELHARAVERFRYEPEANPVALNRGARLELDFARGGPNTTILHAVNLPRPLRHQRRTRDRRGAAVGERPRERDRATRGNGRAELQELVILRKRPQGDSWIFLRDCSEVGRDRGRRSRTTDHHRRQIVERAKPVVRDRLRPHHIARGGLIAEESEKIFRVGQRRGVALERQPQGITGVRELLSPPGRDGPIAPQEVSDRGAHGRPLGADSARRLGSGGDEPGGPARRRCELVPDGYEALRKAALPLTATLQLGEHLLHLGVLLRLLRVVSRHGSPSLVLGYNRPTRVSNDAPRRAWSSTLTPATASFDNSRAPCRPFATSCWRARRSRASSDPSIATTPSEIDVVERGSERPFEPRPRSVHIDARLAAHPGPTTSRRSPSSRVAESRISTTPCKRAFRPATPTRAFAPRDPAEVRSGSSSTRRTNGGDLPHARDTYGRMDGGLTTARHG